MKPSSLDNFEQFYRNNYQELFGFGFHISSDREMTKDVLQDILVDYWERITKGAEIKSPLPYLKIAIRREMFRRIGKQRRTMPLAELKADINTESFEETLIASERLDAKQAWVHRAINKLSATEREMILLKYKQSLSYEEIAQRTGKTKRTIYNQIFNAIKKLQQLLPPTYVLLLVTGQLF